MESKHKQFCLTCVILGLLFLSSSTFVWCFLNKLNAPVIFHMDGEPGERARRMAVKNNDFDALILGSSMSTNFLCSQFNEHFHTNSLKLAESGTSMPKTMQLASFSLAHKNGNIKYVLIDLTCPSSVPPSAGDILSQDNIKEKLARISDFISFDTIRYAFDFFLGGKCNPISRDDYAIWYKDLKDGETPIMAYAKESHKYPGPHEEAYIYSQKNMEKTRKVFEHDVLPVIEHYPNTTFLFFFPPYSMLSYQYANHMECIEFKRMIMEMLLPFPNLRLFDFQNATPVTSVLENYKDYTHYYQNINDWIVEQITLNNYRVTMENQEKMLADFLDTITRYDYEPDRQRLKDIYETLDSKKK